MIHDCNAVAGAPPAHAEPADTSPPLAIWRTGDGRIAAATSPKARADARRFSTLLAAVSVSLLLWIAIFQLIRMGAF